MSVYTDLTVNGLRATFDALADLQSAEIQEHARTLYANGALLGASDSVDNYIKGVGGGFDSVATELELQGAAMKLLSDTLLNSATAIRDANV
jgi:hypothetical protein